MPRKVTSKKSTKRKISDKQLTLFDAIANSEDARDTVRTMLRMSRNPLLAKTTWRGVVATPPGTLLQTVVSTYRDKTDIPLELPFFAVLHFLAYEMLQRGVVVEFVGQEIRPDLWSIALAESGAGKTYTVSTLSKFTGVESTFPEPASAAKFVDDLADHNRELWVRDEFAQFLKSLEQQTHMAEMRDYLLRVYDGKRIERRTKKSEVVIDDPALVIFGLTVLDTFQRNVTAESMLDGFAARFSYIIARKDPTRDSREYPIYDLRGHDDRIRAEWEATISHIKHDRYVVGEDAEQAFRESFALLMPPGEQMPLAFFRRIMFRGIRYALLFHVLLGKESSTLYAVDLGWAGRVCALHIQDAMELIGEHGLSQLERMIRATESLRERIQREEGRDITPRDVARGVYGVGTVQTARAILSIL